MKGNDCEIINIRFLLVVIIVSALAACSSKSPYSDNTNIRANQPAKPAGGFINRVWKVNKSNSVTPGHLYVFLSDGTLVITSPQSKPTIGTWTYKDGSLTMIEDSLPYKVDILKLNENEFEISMNNPGEPVEIKFVPATEGEHTR